MTPAPQPDRSRLMWLAAGLLMVLEFAVFDRMTSRQHAWVYPQWSDQIQYLTESYQSYEVMRAQGWWHGLVYACTNPAAQGTLHDIVAVAVFGVFGPSRLAALEMNFAAFLAWQAVTFVAVYRLTRSPALSWISFGLLLGLAGPWSADAGSAVDFRLDHAAMCLWGIAAATALLTDGFRKAGWSLAFGAATGLTVVERFLTGAYFAPVFIAAVVWILCGEEKARRLRHLALAGAVAFVLAAPFFWMHRTWIYNYYWMGHFANADSAARAPGLGLGGSLAYIFEGFTRRQLGPVFCTLVVVVSVIPLLLESFWDRLRAARPALDRNWRFLAAVFFVVPTIVLCLHRQKSEYVLGILAPGAVLLLLWLWNFLLPGLPTFPRRTGPTLLNTVAGATLALGLGFFLYRQCTPAHSANFTAGARQVQEFTKRIYLTSQRNDLKAPLIGADRVSDALDGLMFSVTHYEKHKEWVQFANLLPQGILPFEEAEIFARLERCDFVFLTDQMPGHGHWPYDQQMKKLHPQVKAWCDTHLERVAEFPLFDAQMSLYQRRGLR